MKIAVLGTGSVGETIGSKLVSLGHEVKMGGDWDDLFGHAHCIWLDPDGGLAGGSDPRADGAALGY